MTFENVEMKAEHMGYPSPSAYIYPNGSVIYFDDKGEQIPEFQIIGIKALKSYRNRFPNSKIHWGVWRSWNHEMTDESIQSLIDHLKMPAHPWGDFLEVRMHTIQWMRERGDDDSQIARALSMDEEQVYLIRTSTGIKWIS